MFYRLVQESDIDEICELIKAAICSMEEQGIFVKFQFDRPGNRD